MFPPWLGHSLFREVSRGRFRTARLGKPRPMTLLPTLEASTRFSVVFGGPPTAMRNFDSNLVSHKEPLVILGDALLGGLPTFKFDETITKPRYYGVLESVRTSRYAQQTYFNSTLTIVPILPKQLSKSSFRVCSGRPPI